LKEAIVGVARVVHKIKQSLFPGTASPLYTYLPDRIGFHSAQAHCLRTIYFPLCGTDAASIKSSITPFLSGDIKVDKNSYLTKPVSVQDLRQGVRNFYCHIKGKGVVALADGGGTKISIEAGLLWHKAVRRYTEAGLELQALNFVPVTGECVELMRVTVKNISNKNCRFTPTFSLPLFARALANKHDHEQVTSLLHRIEQLPNGVCVQPTMIFDERGHQPGEYIYYVRGVDDQGKAPLGTFPTVEHFYGDGGNISEPEVVWENRPPQRLPQAALQGKEAVGALRFEDADLTPGGHREYLIVIGREATRAGMDQVFQSFHTPEQFDASLAQNRAYWQEKVGTIQFLTGAPAETAWWQWVTLQPILRRIFGCSFLPDHDYGKGGKGWRDLWQDLLSLILIEPWDVRGRLINNFAGVRIDGSNATIIGTRPGEFVADRNFITRVWMDHGVWPLATLLLYLDQTGDYDILLEDNTYFRDVQFSRTYEKDYAWTAGHGNYLKDKHGKVYRGSIIEHLLIQHLVQFFNVGEHNIIRLEDADWNDGLDMAKERGESVAFMSFYGGNLMALADLLSDLSREKGIQEIALAVEIKTLLDSLTSMHVDYHDPQAKKDYLFEVYFPSVQSEISGQKIAVAVQDIIGDLRNKGEWIFAQIRNHEKITVEHKGQTNRWFNGYYDNQGRRVEGRQAGQVRMTLTGQVFPVMSGLASKEDIEDIIASVRQYLRDERTGGLHLNTDFCLDHYFDLGRAFGFAYGTKENGAFFSHMTVMYAYALYKRGYVQEGHDVLRSLREMAMDSSKSKIYPGVPEYFDNEGRGHYHYLTGAASWLVLTQLTQVYGVRGARGNLRIEPKLVLDEFNPKTGEVSVVCHFAGKRIAVAFKNFKKLDYGQYRIKEVLLNEDAIEPVEKEAGRVLIARATIAQAPENSRILVVLDSQ
jgi:cellobiose phosphorylase